MIIRITYTDCQSVWIIRIANPYVYYNIDLSWSCRRKKLTSSIVAPQHPRWRQSHTTNNHAIVHLDQTSHKTKWGARLKGYEIEWCMKKKKPTNVEEKVNKGNFGILKKLLGVEELCMIVGIYYLLSFLSPPFWKQYLQS